MVMKSIIDGAWRFGLWGVIELYPPLLKYAAQGWGKHSCNLNNNGVTKYAIRLLLDDRKVALVGKILLQQERWHGSGLHLCSFFGLECIARSLLELGCPVNSRDFHDDTPLHYAAQYGHGQMARLLLEIRDVNVDARNYLCQTPLLCAVEKGYEEVAKLLIELGEVDVNARDKQSRTPLSLAVRGGYEKVAKLLIETGKADVNSRDLDGWAPGFLAVVRGYGRLAKLLIETGKIDYNKRDKEYGRTLLSWASKGGLRGGGKAADRDR